MKVVVIGASGHIGNAIVRLLLARRHQVTACGRRKEPPVNLAGLRVNYISGDAEAAGQLDRWVAGHDLVVDAAAPYPVGIFGNLKEPAGDPVARAEVRTQRLLSAVGRHKARLAYIGSCVTLARPRTAVQQLPADLIKQAHPYFHVKELIERQIVEACRNGTRAVILEAVYCLGPWDIHERRYCTIALLLAGEIPGFINQVLHVIDVRDVARAMLSALESERYGEPILLSAYQVTNQDLYEQICKIGGVPAPQIAFRTLPTLAGAYMLEVMLGLAGIETPLSSGAIMISTMFDYLEPHGELEMLGIRPRPISRTIADSIKWYRKIGYC